MSSTHEAMRAGTRLDGLRQGSLLVVFGIAVAFALLAGAPAEGGDPERAQGARRLPEGVYLIDGDRAGKAVRFPHDAHVEQIGDDACAACHHMNKPGDTATSCYECHRRTRAVTDLFDHTTHAEAHGGNRGCATCHADPGRPKVRANTPTCLSCHPTMVAGDDLIEAPAPDSPLRAPGYFDAMHKACQGCHEMETCKTCHPPNGKTTVKEGHE